MRQHSQHTNVESRKMGARLTRFAAAMMTTLAVALTLAADGRAQTVVPITFASNVAGIAPGGTSTACSSTSDIPTFSGGPVVAVHYGDGCAPNQAVLITPYTTVADSLGNIYIADYGHYALRVIYNGGTALAAAIVAANPTITNLVPTKGLIYTIVGGSRSATIVKTAPASNPSGTTQYYCNSAGTGAIALDSNGSGCPGSQAEAKVRSVALDNDGNVFFTSTSGGGQSVHVFCVQCAAGSALATLLGLELPGKTPQTGYIYELAGKSTNGWNGDGGLAIAGTLYSVRDVAVDANENVYISDGAANVPTTTASNNNIRVIYAGIGPIPGLTGVPSPVAGDIYTLAGSGGCTYPNTTGCAGGTIGGTDGDGGLATSATFNSPYALFLDANANVYVADYSNARVRVIYQGTGTVVNVPSPMKGDIYTVAGGGATAATLSTSGTLATQLAFGVVFVASMDPSGNIYLYDNTNKYLWRVDGKTGIAVVVGGAGSAAAPGANHACSAATNAPTSIDTNGDGCPATQTVLGPSGGFGFDPQGNFYETESSSTTSVVRRFSLNTQFAGTAIGTPVTQPLAFENVSAAATYTAENFNLQGSATTEFADTGSDTCALNTSIPVDTTCIFNVQFSPKQAGLREGSVTLTGSTISSYLSGLGQAANASIDPGTQTTIGTGLNVEGVGTDLLGNLYISDATGTVQKVTAAGGTPATLISGLSNPAQVAVDGKGNVYVADTGHNRIAMTTAAGGTVTPLGTGLSGPTGVAVDGLGNVYVSDTGNKRLVKLFAGGGQQTIALTGANAPVPTGLALDAAGDLFVVDTANSDVVEVSASASQTALTFTVGATPVVPSAVAVDAAGDLYVADATNKQVVDALVGSNGLSNPLAITGLAGPLALALDANGSVYVADSGAAGVIAVDRALGNISFPTTNAQPAQTSMVDITFSNTGNEPLIFNGSQFATATGDTAVFSLTSGSTNSCTLGSATPITAGGSCRLTANFSPVVSGVVSETISPVTNAANNAGVSAVLSGKGAILVPTSTSISTNPSVSVAVSYGQTVTASSTVTLTSSTPGPVDSAATITFTVDGRALAAQPYGTGTVTTILSSLTVGAHSVSVSFSGDANYASSSNSVSFNVVQATTTTTLVSAPTVTSGAPTTTFTATIAPATGTGETGTVNFYSGATLLNPSPITVSNNAASYTTIATSFASNSFKAVYTGDANFAGSSSIATTPPVDFNLTGSSVVTIPQGGNASATVTITPYFGYSGTLVPSCSGLPAYSVCRFQPTSVTVSGSAQTIFNISIYTSTNLTSQNRNGGMGLTLALLSPLGMAVLLFTRRRGLLGRHALLALVLLFSLVGVAGLSGCTNPLPVAPGGTTPAGTVPVTVTFTDQATKASHSISFQFVVIATS